MSQIFLNSVDFYVQEDPWLCWRSCLRILKSPFKIKLFSPKQCLSYGNRIKLPNNSPVMFIFYPKETGMSVRRHTLPLAWN